MITGESDEEDQDGRPDPAGARHDHACFILFGFPSLYHYATLHPAVEKWYALGCALCAFLSLFWLTEDD